MIKKQLTLSEIAEHLKNHNPKNSAEILDEFYGYLITAGAIASLVFMSDPTTAITAFCTTAGMSSLKISRLIAWLPDKLKFEKKDRQAFALEKYELSGIVNVMLFNLAIRQSFADNLAPTLNIVLSTLNLSEEDKVQLDKLSKEADENQNSAIIRTHVQAGKEDIEHYALEVIKPLLLILEKMLNEAKKSKKQSLALDIPKSKQKFLDAAFLNYNAFLINLSSEYPEFALWADVSLKQKILKELRQSANSLKENDRKLELTFISSIEKVIKKIEDLRDQSFSKAPGFPTFLKSYEELFKRQAEHITHQQNIKSRENIQAHLNQIKGELNKPLIENDDIEDIIYPLVKDIYIAQSFESFSYHKKTHGRGFLTPQFWSRHAIRGENIANELLVTLADPNYCNKPIVILGNPGAGKSMLSKMLAGKLTETNDFIPFLIKLRNVATGTTNISEHIAKGLSKSIENLNDVNWLEWAKEFKDRIPVIILDGFDELMRFSQSELNNYLNAIKDFQETALNHGICCKVILTSRIAVMQDVNIPEHTKIIKLNGFDPERKSLWISIWNNHQKKTGYKFVLPDDENIQQLAEEPLLLFMLGVYDFESSELQNMVQTMDFSQSKLYDSLLNSFASRQLEKNDKYRNASVEQKKNEKETFRLRLGMIALLMFLNDTTHKDTHNLKHELDAFELDNSSIQKDSILGGFFFIHENKSVTEGEIEQYNYEFLHKTFGEFLAADFMLRVAVKQCGFRNQEKLATDGTFKFCFGYNWLHKHNNILVFLMEHCPSLVPYPGDLATHIIERIIKKDLKELFNKGFQGFTVNEFIIIKPREVIEHLAMYSQNLLFLWAAVSGNHNKFRFEIFDINDNLEADNTEALKYQAQDRDEINRNKILWKRLCQLWTLVGNKYATAKLIDWLTMDEKHSELLLIKDRSEVNHNFGDAALITCNDFERILSLFDLDNPPDIRSEDMLRYIQKTISAKPELRALGIDAMLYRMLHHRHFHLEYIHWLNTVDLSRHQSFDFVKAVFVAREQLTTTEKYEIMRAQNGTLTFKLILHEILLDLETDLPEFKSSDFLSMVNDLLSSEAREKLFHHDSDPDTLLYYVQVLKKMNVSWISESRLHRGLYEDLFHILRRGFTDLENPKYNLPTYLKAITEIGTFYAENGRRHLKFHDEIIHDFFNEFNHYIESAPTLAIEYLKALSIFMDGFGRGLMSNKRVSEVIQGIIRNPEFFFQNDIPVVLSFFQAVNQLSKTNRIKVKFDEGVIEELVYRLISEIDHRSNQEYWNFADITELLGEIRKQAPNTYLQNSRRFDQAIKILYEEFRSINRDEPNFGLNLLDLALNVQAFFEGSIEPIQYIIRESTENVMREMGYISHEAPHIASDFLMRLLIMTRVINFDDNPALYDLIREVARFKLPLKVRNKLGLLLLTRDVDPALVASLLEQSPKLLKLFNTSPDIAIQLSEILQEIE